MPICHNHGDSLIQHSEPGGKCPLCRALEAQTVLARVLRNCIEEGKRLQTDLARSRRALELMSREYVVLEANVKEGGWVSPYGSEKQHGELAAEVLNKYAAQAKVEIEDAPA